MYLLIWNGTVHSYGDAGKKDGIVHAGGDDHGSRADEKCYALRNVSVHGESGCGSGDGCGEESDNWAHCHIRLSFVLYGKFQRRRFPYVVFADRPEFPAGNAICRKWT